MNKLRNNETHFFITANDKEEFLTEDNFIDFYNLMVDYYDILEEYDLLPYWGDSNHNSSFYRFCFKKDKISTFSYRAALEKSQIVSKICKHISAEFDCYYYPITVFELTESFLEYHMDEKYIINDNYSLIEMMIKQKIIKEEHIDILDNDEHREYFSLTLCINTD